LLKRQQKEPQVDEEKKEGEEAKEAVAKEMPKIQEDSDDDEAYRSVEEVNSDDLDGGLAYSDNEDEDDGFRKQLNSQKAAWKKAPARQFKQEMDTNVFKVEFATLKDKAELATGDPTICEKCGAVHNVHSKIEEVKGEEE